MLLSRSCEYALQAVIYLAAKTKDTPIFQQDISRALNIPPHFLGKILQVLTHHQIVTSRKGKKGGFLLAKPSEAIYLYDIIKVIDGPNFLDRCVLGFPGCSDTSPCPVHIEWIKAKKIIIDMLSNRTIEELSRVIDIKLNFIKSLSQGKKA